jgi:hypothetical protein
MLADLPAMLLGGITLSPFLLLLVNSREAASYVAAIGWIVFGSLQWWIVGLSFTLKPDVY